MPQAASWSPRLRGPSVVALLFGFWALVACLGFSGWLLNADGDLARHVLLGQHIFTHGVIFPDVWSHTKPGGTFVAYEWLSEVILAGIHSLGGLSAVVLFCGTLIAASVALVAVYLRGSLETAWILVVGSSIPVLTFPHWIARPHLFSFLCISILLLITRMTPGWKRNVGVLVLFSFWANLHPGFFYGVAVFWAFLFGDLLDRYSPLLLKQNGLSALCAVLGTLLNPFGWGLHINVFGHLADSRALKLIEEFQPIPWTGLYGILFFCCLAFLIWAMSIREKRLPLAVFIPFIASMFAALVAIRNVSLFALFAFPLVMNALASTVKGWHWKPLEHPRKAMEADDRKATTLPYVAIVLVILGFLGVSSGRLGPAQLVADSFSEEDFPVEAVRRAREAGLDNHTVLNQYGWGGFILYAWPEQEIFIDGMANFFGSELMEEYHSLLLTQEGWKERLRERGIDLMIFPPNTQLVREAMKLPGWTVWYEDSTAIVLLNQNPPSVRKAADPVG